MSAVDRFAVHDQTGGKHRPGEQDGKIAAVMGALERLDGMTRQLENIPGAAGTIGLARLVSGERGNGDVTMLSGLIMLAAVVTHRSAITLRDVTPSLGKIRYR